MALTLQAGFSHQLNTVLPLNPPVNTPGASVPTGTQGLAVRVASQQSGTLGTLTASGFAAVPAWILRNAPPFVSISLDSTNTICTITFGAAVFAANAYEFYIQCTDGTTTVYFPIYVEVRTPLSLSATPASSSNLTVSGNTITVTSFDNTIADIEIETVGLFGQSPASGAVNFILPSGGLGTFPGLEWITSDQTKLIFRVADPSFSDLAGGAQVYTGSSRFVQPLQVLAYQPATASAVGGFYDTPDRAYPATFTIQSFQLKSGTLDVVIGQYTDPATSYIHLDAVVSYLQGKPVTGLLYQWSTSGTAGPMTVVGGSSTSSTVAYSATGTGTFTAVLSVKNSLSVVLGTFTVGPIRAAAVGSWNATSSAKIDLAGGVDLKQGYIGDVIAVTISADGVLSPPSAEDFAVTFSVTNGSTLEPTLAAPATVHLTAGNGFQQTVNVTIPSGALIGEKWNLIAVATSGTRTGNAQMAIESNGAPPLLATTDGVPAHTIPTTITSNTGASITPIPLVAINNDPASGSYQNVVSPALWELVGAPDGLFIQNVSGNFQLAGNALKSGSYTFKIAVSSTGYTRSYTTTITLNVSVNQVPLVVGGLIGPVSTSDSPTQFNVSWSISGNAQQLVLQQEPSNNPIFNVTGSGTQSLSQIGSCVYEVFGTSFYGNAYAVPILVASSSVQALQKLRSAPTVALIDDTNSLTVNWQPFTGPDGQYDQYKGWDIFYHQPSQTAIPVFKAAALNPGETVSSRSYTTILASGDWFLNMQAISNDHTAALDSDEWKSSTAVTDLEFPTGLTQNDVTLDNATVLLGQPVNVTLQPTYTGADQWNVIFPDNTSTGWQSLANSVVPKSFQVPGALNIVIQTRKLYNTPLNDPPVILIRQLSKQIFVMDQEFNPQAAAEGALTGNLGVGGLQGFEIVNATTGAVTPQPWEVIVRAIVRDTVTNELKLLVATSRFSNASSLLGSMGIDVFPIEGRPKERELISPIFEVTVGPNTSSRPVRIQTSQLPNVIVGKPMADFALTATGGTTPYLWSSDSLPPGIRMSTSGVISGTPLQLGAFDINFAAQDSSSPFYIDEVTLVLIVQTDLAIRNATIPDATVGTPYNVQMLVGNALGGAQPGGLPPYTWAIVAGALPIGIAINPNTGVLSGVPCTYNSTTDFSKIFTATIQVTDAIGAKASRVYSIHLFPAALQFGLLNQPTIFAAEDFKLVVPIFGGRSPYTLASFSEPPSDQIVGSGLNVISPTEIGVQAGVSSPGLSILTGNQLIFVEGPYPRTIVFNLTATGGVPSGLPSFAADDYKFLVDPSGATTLANAQVYGNLLIAEPTTDGTYTVAVKAIDSVGHSVTKSITVTTQLQAPPNGAATFKAQTGVIDTTGTPLLPQNWIFTSGAFPDALRGNNYTPGANKYYAVVVTKNNALFRTNPNEPTDPTITFNCPLTGILPPSITAVSGNTIAGGTGADGIILIQGNPTGTISIDGPYSFETEFENITSPTAALVVAEARHSITVVESGSTTTPVVVVTSTQEMDIDLNTVSPNTAGTSNQYSWAYPLSAEGGTGPYTFSIISGTTLPSVVTTNVNSSILLPAFASLTSTTGIYSVRVQATDSLGTVSAPVTIIVNIQRSNTQPIHILDNTLPLKLYVNRPIPANTYFIDSDLIASWTATGLPAGVSISSAPSTRAYLQGTPTLTGNYTLSITATSVTFGTTATAPFPLQIAAQTAKIVAPSLPPHSTPTTATVGTQYRVVNNSVYFSVQYTGFQPGDANLPTLVNTVGSNTIGAPGVPIGGQPSTGNRSLTADGFIMDYDYLPTVQGPDSITLKFSSTIYDGPITVNDVYSTLIATGTTVAQSISEYATTGTFNLPIQVSGGNPTYSFEVTGVSDPRFTVISNNTPNAQLQITITDFAPGVTVNCSVNVTVTDSSSPVQTANATGTLQVTVAQETYITADFSDYTWPISLSAGGGVSNGQIILNQLMSIPQLFHAPASYTVTGVSIPGGLGILIVASPSSRVLAYSLNATPGSVSFSDVDSELNASGTFLVANVNPSVPAPGTYNISVTLHVTDAHGITLSHTNTVAVVITA